MPKPVTMTQVARAAGVAQSTVSFVLNGRQTSVTIKEATRKRVLKAAKQLGYRPNEIARAMVRGRTRVMVFLTYDACAEYVARTFTGFSEIAHKFNYLPSIHPTGWSNLHDVIERCLDSRPAAIIGHELRYQTQVEFHRQAKAAGIPFGYGGETGDISWPIHVQTNLDAAGELVWRHFRKLGHTKFVYLSLDSKVFPFTRKAREEPFIKVMLADGFPRPPIINDDEKLEFNLRQLFQSSGRPTAVICASDCLAMKALRTALGLGLKVPQQLSVIGFSNLEMGSLMYPSLTSLEEHRYEIGELLAHLTVEAIERNKPAKPIRRYVHPQLVLRESVGPAPS